MNANLYDNFIAKKATEPKEYVSWEDAQQADWQNPQKAQFVSQSFQLPAGFEIGGYAGSDGTHDAYRQGYISKQFGDYDKALMKHTYENGERSTTLLNEVNTPYGNIRIGTTNRDGSWTPAYQYMKNFHGWGVSADGYKDTDGDWYHGVSIGMPIGEEGTLKLTGKTGPYNKRIYAYYETPMSTAHSKEWLKEHGR